MDRLFASHKVKHTVWDLTAADLSGFMATQFLEISERGSRYSHIRGPGARAALVGKSKFDRMLLEAFRVYASQSIKRELGIFDTLEEAFAWLQND